MTRGDTRRSRGTHHPNTFEGPKYLRGTRTQSITREYEKQCLLMPPQGLSFLLKSCHSLDLHDLMRFWSNPTMSEYTHGKMAGVAAGASWFIAMRYWMIGKVTEAGALALNGCFLYQCRHTNIETMVEMCGNDFSNSVWGAKFPLLKRCLHTIQTPQVLKHFLLNDIPFEYRDMMSCFDGFYSSDEKMGYVESVSDAWKLSSTSNHQKPTSGASVGAQTQLIIVDDTNNGRYHSFNVGSSTTLKVVFNDYADKRGISLRSLRFSHCGKILFLSSIGNKTPGELNLGDRDVINVIDTSAPTQEPRSDNSNQMKKKAKFKNRPNSKGRRKSNVPMTQEEPAENLDAFKAQHSKMLTNLHEELHPQLKKIRNRLNALTLECQPQKQKRMKKGKKTNTESTGSHVLPNPGTGGKAGKPYFTIQVGEVENLYKTKKSCHLGKHVTPGTLDLHGYSESQALHTLNEKLPEWVETAMKGEYPWVITVQIICGCGSQVLSQAVHKWIKLTRNVCNAPKNCIR